MSFRDRLHELQTPADVDAFLAEHADVAVFFKAGGCHKTMQGFGYIEQLLFDRDVHVGVTRVLEGGKPAATYIEQKTGLEHHSPQFIVMKAGAPVFDLDNWDITLENLQAALAHLPEPSETAQSSTDGTPEVDPLMKRYLGLLHGFIIDEIPHEVFRANWLMTLRDDSGLRSREFFDALDSLFGNVDGHIHGELPPVPEAELREKAKAAFATLTDMLGIEVG